MALRKHRMIFGPEALSSDRALQLEQTLLHRQTRGRRVAAEVSAGRQDSVAGDDQRPAVIPHHVSDGACGTGATDLGRKFAVAERFSGPDASASLRYRQLKWGQPVGVERDIKEIIVAIPARPSLKAFRERSESRSKHLGRARFRWSAHRLLGRLGGIVAKRQLSKKHAVPNST